MREDNFIKEMEEAGYPVRLWGNAPGDTYGRHSHSYKKILCCLEGSVTFHTDQGDITLRPGERLVLQPGQVHSATVGMDGVRCAEAHVS
jgi:quercetin dioxygenase-like cupin family protein